MFPFCLGKQQFLIDRINLLFSLNRYVWLTLVVLVDHHLFVAAKTWLKNHHSCERKKPENHGDLTWLLPWWPMRPCWSRSAWSTPTISARHLEVCHKPRSPRLQWDVKQTWNLWRYTKKYQIESNHGGYMWFMNVSFCIWGKNCELLGYFINLFYDVIKGQCNRWINIFIKQLLDKYRQEVAYWMTNFIPLINQWLLICYKPTIGCWTYVLPLHPRLLSPWIMNMGKKNRDW